MYNFIQWFIVWLVVRIIILIPTWPNCTLDKIVIRNDYRGNNKDTVDRKSALRSVQTGLCALAQMRHLYSYCVRNTPIPTLFGKSLTQLSFLFLFFSPLWQRKIIQLWSTVTYIWMKHLFRSTGDLMLSIVVNVSGIHWWFVQPPTPPTPPTHTHTHTPPLARCQAGWDPTPSDPAQDKRWWVINGWMDIKRHTVLWPVL